MSQFVIAGNCRKTKKGEGVQVGIRTDKGWVNYFIAISLLKDLLEGKRDRIPVSIVVG
jgi:hypothetical protein